MENLLWDNSHYQKKKWQHILEEWIQSTLDKPDYWMGIDFLFRKNPDFVKKIAELEQVQNTTTRLYCIENPNKKYEERREWVVSKKELIGMWFNEEPRSLINHIKSNSREPWIRLVYVDIPSSKLDQYDASRNALTEWMDYEKENKLIPRDIERSYVDLWHLNNKNVFLSLKELEQITQELPPKKVPDGIIKHLYAEYLDSIFPNSYVKNIVYHGTNKQFENFSREFDGSWSWNSENTVLGIYAAEAIATAGIFTEWVYSNTDYTELYEKLKKEGRIDDRRHILDQMIWKKEPLFKKWRFYSYYGTKTSTILALRINITNPLHISASVFAKTYDPKISFSEREKTIQHIQSMMIGYDWVIVDSSDPDTPRSEELNSDNYIISDPDKILILGSEDDYQDFKEWLSSNNK